MYRNLACKVAAIFQEPVHPLNEAGQPPDVFFFECLDREQRHDSHNRADLERNVLAVDQDLIVVKSVLIVP